MTPWPGFGRAGSIRSYPVRYIIPVPDALATTVWAQVAPPAFSVVVDSSQGPFTVHVNTSWAPPFAQRFYTLVLLSYFDGAPLYRVLPGFVSQFG